MKYRKILFEQLKKQSYFDKNAIIQLSRQYGLKETTVDTYISRALKYKEIVPLKKGFYVSFDFFGKNKNNIHYLFYLANILRKPSYVSSWAALQYYNLSTELTYTITSITTKITRLYNTKAGNFSYHSIKKELFLDFSLIKGDFDFFIASPSKALFDLLYFKTQQFRGVEFKDIRGLIENCRIDIDEMNKKEQKKFFSMIKKYTL